MRNRPEKGIGHEISPDDDEKDDIRQILPNKTAQLSNEITEIRRALFRSAPPATRETPLTIIMAPYSKMTPRKMWSFSFPKAAAVLS